MLQNFQFRVEARDLLEGREGLGVCGEREKRPPSSDAGHLLEMGMLRAQSAMRELAPRREVGRDWVLPAMFVPLPESAQPAAG